MQHAQHMVVYYLALGATAYAHGHGEASDKAWRMVMFYLRASREEQL